MADRDHPAHERPTLGAQLARQHELLMAQATKPARQGAQTFEWSERHVGAHDGELRLASAVFVQHDDETDLQFLGRQIELLRAARLEQSRFNAEIVAGREAAAKTQAAEAA